MCKEHYRRGAVAGRFRLPFLWLLSKAERIRPGTSTQTSLPKDGTRSGTATRTGILKNPATEINPGEDIIIAVMGPTGTGKSTFINVATEQNSTAVGNTLKSRTSEVQAVRCLHPDTRCPIVFVDTPGFDDTQKSDTEILEMIADWLANTYNKDITLAGIIYMHRITDHRMAGSPLKNLRVFQNLCGQSAIRKVLLATTMWSSKVSPIVGIQREKQLHEKFWKPMLQLGSATARFQNTYESAWSIVDIILAKDFEPTPLLLQDEMVRLKRRLHETQAGMALYDTLQKLMEQQKETLQELRHVAEAHNDAELQAQFNEAYTSIQEQLRKTVDEIQRMTVPVERRMLGLLTFRAAPSAAPEFAHQD